MIIGKCVGAVIGYVVTRTVLGTLAGFALGTMLDGVLRLVWHIIYDRITADERRQRRERVEEFLRSTAEASARAERQKQEEEQRKQEEEQRRREEEQRRQEEGYRNVANGAAVFTLDDAYRTLGIAPNVTDDVVKRTYRTLVVKNHPDRVADLDECIRRAATIRLQEINKAKEMIYRSRNMK